MATKLRGEKIDSLVEAAFRAQESANGSRPGLWIMRIGRRVVVSRGEDVPVEGVRKGEVEWIGREKLAGLRGRKEVIF